MNLDNPPITPGFLPSSEAKVEGEEDLVVVVGLPAEILVVEEGEGMVIVRTTVLRLGWGCEMVKGTVVVEVTNEINKAATTAVVTRAEARSVPKQRALTSGRNAEGLTSGEAAKISMPQLEGLVEVTAGPRSS